MTELSAVSVVVPTRNCRHLVEAGLAEMRQWAPHVREVLVVDSESTDGTPEALREGLPFSNVRILTHPPGLYQSWNFGINHTSGEWVHVSTAGDTINAEDLLCLLRAGESANADVVVAPPNFVFEEGYQPQWTRWPIHELLDREPDAEVIVMEKMGLLAFAMEFSRLAITVQSWLGSSASNLYRRSVFVGRAFPLDCGHSGDVMFGLRYASELRAAFLRRPCGQFVFHRPTGVQPSILERYPDVYAAEYKRCQSLLQQHLRHAIEQSPELKSCLSPGVEDSFWRALEHSPDDMVRMATELADEKKKRRETREKLEATRAEREAFKQRARDAEHAQGRYRRVIPSFLRRLLKLDS